MQKQILNSSSSKQVWNSEQQWNNNNYEIAAVKEQYNLASRWKKKTDCARVQGILRMRRKVQFPIAV